MYLINIKFMYIREWISFLVSLFTLPKRKGHQINLPTHTTHPYPQLHNTLSMTGWGPVVLCWDEITVTRTNEKYKFSESQFMLTIPWQWQWQWQRVAGIVASINGEEFARITGNNNNEYEW